jgi:hypothetical protein
MEQLAIEDMTTRYHLDAQRFILRNPRFWKYVVDTVHIVHRAKKRTGMKALVEYARFQMFLEEPGDGYRINNNWTAAFARILLDDYPYLTDTISTRHAPMTERSAMWGRMGGHDGAV